MYIINSKIKSQIKIALIDALRHRVDMSYRTSQVRVPVRTGYLKRHGFFSVVENGAQIIYSPIYSSYVERGIRGGNQNVRGHYRRDGTYVRPFTRYIPPREGKHYIESSLRDNFEDELANDFDAQLRIRFKNVKKE